MSDLKPCPFCGGNNLVYRAKRNGTKYDAYLQCKDCRASSPMIFAENVDSREDILQNVNVLRAVAKYWNSRRINTA